MHGNARSQLDGRLLLGQVAPIGPYDFGVLARQLQVDPLIVVMVDRVEVHLAALVDFELILENVNGRRGRPVDAVVLEEQLGVGGEHASLVARVHEAAGKDGILEYGLSGRRLPVLEVVFTRRVRG